MCGLAPTTWVPRPPRARRGSAFAQLLARQSRGNLRRLHAVSIPIDPSPPNLCSHAGCWTNVPRRTSAARPLDPEPAVFLQLLPVDRDPPALTQVADHVPVHSGVVAAAGLGI